MSAIIKTYQKCPKCGARFPSSKGGFPIVCQNGCMTQPTKYYFRVKWKGRGEDLYHDRDGRTVHDWGHALAVLGDINSRIASHKTGKGFFDPSAYKQQSSTSFSAFWARFEAKYSGSTMDKLSAIGKHHLDYFADFQMRDIVTWHVDEWWHGILDKGLSVAYTNDILVWLKTFFKQALELDIIVKMPKFPKALYKPEPDVDEYLTGEEQILILSHIPDNDRPIFEFLMLTGCRVNEACALQIDDVNQRTGKVNIQNTIKRDGSVGIVKNKKIRRPPYAGQIKDCIKRAMAIGGLGNRFVFVNRWGRRYSDDYLRYAFNRACDDAGIKRVKLKNATRHSRGMRMLEEGYDMETVRDFFGHSNTRMTRHYAKVLDSKLDELYGIGLDGGRDNAIDVNKKG